jgi:hypothetical protein
MNRVLVNVMSGDWSVHFIGPDGQTRIRPWLLHDSHDEVKKLLRWGNPAADEWKEHDLARKISARREDEIYATEASIHHVAIGTSRRVCRNS